MPAAHEGGTAVNLGSGGEVAGDASGRGGRKGVARIDHEGVGGAVRPAGAVGTGTPGAEAADRALGLPAEGERLLGRVERGVADTVDDELVKVVGAQIGAQGVEVIRAVGLGPPGSVSSSAKVLKKFQTMSRASARRQRRAREAPRARAKGGRRFMRGGG